MSILHIVPARPEYVRAEDLKAGETYRIDSGLGGSWEVEYLAPNRHGIHVFIRRPRPDWPEKCFWFEDHQIPSTVYRLVPDAT
jgi:hypothetical protein